MFSGGALSEECLVLKAVWSSALGKCAELPRDVREKLVSWNHTQDYETAGYQDYASRLGGGQYEKVWDLGEYPSSASPVIMHVYCPLTSRPHAHLPKQPYCTSLLLSILPNRCCAVLKTCYGCWTGGDHKFLADHVVDGRILMPATSYVVTAWEALCNMKSRKMEETPVAFEDVQIRQAVTAEEGQKVALAVLIAPDNRFNVRLPPAWPLGFISRVFKGSWAI